MERRREKYFPTFRLSRPRKVTEMELQWTTRYWILRYPVLNHLSKIKRNYFQRQVNSALARHRMQERIHLASKLHPATSQRSETTSAYSHQYQLQVNKRKNNNHEDINLCNRNNYRNIAKDSEFLTWSTTIRGHENWSKEEFFLSIYVPTLN